MVWDWMTVVSPGARSWFLQRDPKSRQVCVSCSRYQTLVVCQTGAVARTSVLLVPNSYTNIPELPELDSLEPPIFRSDDPRRLIYGVVVYEI